MLLRNSKETVLTLFTIIYRIEVCGSTYSGVCIRITASTMPSKFQDFPVPCT